MVPPGKGHPLQIMKLDSPFDSNRLEDAQEAAPLRHTRFRLCSPPAATSRFMHTPRKRYAGHLESYFACL
jgi:hypothetical protein